MNKFFKITLIIPVLLIGFVFTAQTQVEAQLNPFDIEFPVSELGNCGSMDECKIFCDDSNNAIACTEWAKAKGFIQPPPIESGPDGQARQVLAEREGPGGCKNPQECDIYCSQPEHGDECFNFGKEHGLMPSDEIERIEREMQEREGPGECRSREECDAFCRNPDNNRICLEFVVREGKISQEEADFMLQRMDMPHRGPEGPGHPGPEGPGIDEEKAKQLLAEKDGPGGCKTMDECDAFCSTPENDEICLNFAIENGLISPDEIEKIKKMMNTVGPGGCRGIECKIYCDNPEHGEECLNFAIDQGFIDPEEAEQARKFMDIAKQGGPGGCKGPQECDVYCSQPEHGEECFNFGKEHGLMRPDEIKMMEREMEIMKKLDQQGGPGDCRSGEECRDYCQNPDNFDECAAFSVESGMMSTDKAETMLREFMDVEERKFERFGPPGEFGPMPSEFGEFGPPEGFEDKFKERFNIFEKHIEGFEERDEFCSNPENFEECRFSSGFPPPDEFPGGPGEFPGMPGEFPPPKEFPGRDCSDILCTLEVFPVSEIERKSCAGRGGHIEPSYGERGCCQNGWQCKVGDEFPPSVEFFPPEEIMLKEMMFPEEALSPENFIPQEILSPENFMPLQEMMFPEQVMPEETMLFEGFIPEEMPHSEEFIPEEIIFPGETQEFPQSEEFFPVEPFIEEPPSVEPFIEEPAPIEEPPPEAGIRLLIGSAISSFLGLFQ